MIDVSQWRSSIGLWYSSCQPFYCLRSVKSSTVLGQSEREQLLSSLIEILLILSGNVELNPGPTTDDVRKILQNVLRENFAVLSEAIKHCVPRTAELMYSSGLISGYQVDTNNRQSMIDEFDKGMLFKNDVSELQCHCQLFLDCLSCQGDPPLEVAQRLAKIWTERIQQELKISLSLNFVIKHVQPVETISSSTSDPIMAASRPQMDQLLEWLKPLVEWENFAVYLPGMTNDDVEKIKKDEKATDNQKRAVYSKWLEVCPTASWNDVITALERDKKMSLANNVRQNLNEIQSPSNSLTEEQTENISSEANKQKEISPQNCGVNNVPIKVTLPSEDEHKIKGNLNDLRKEFASLLRKFREEYQFAVKNGTLELSVVIDYIQDSIGTDKDLRSCQTINDLLQNIKDSVDFLDCQVLVETTEEFLSSDLSSKFQAHLKKSEELRSSTSVKTLREQLHKIYQPHAHNPENAPKALISLHTVWDNATINGLNTLMRKFFSRRISELLLEKLEITKASVHIKYYMTESQDEIKQVIEYCQQNVSIMRYIGIFGLEIDGVIILDDQHEDEHYTFEYGLLKAAEDGHNEAVQFLVELGIDVNHVTEEGQTPLTLAITNGHGHVMETLISAGANVNPQVEKMRASMKLQFDDTCISEQDDIYYILMNEKDGIVSTAANKRCIVSRGEILIKVNSEQHSPASYRVYSQSDVMVSALRDDDINICPLKGSEVDYLLAVHPLSARVSEYMQTEKMRASMELKVGDTAQIKLPMMRKDVIVNGRIHYIGRISGKDGIHFGVEITDEKYHGRGTTDGGPHFTCEANNGVYVGIDKIVEKIQQQNLSAAPKSRNEGATASQSLSYFQRAKDFVSSAFIKPVIVGEVHPNEDYRYKPGDGVILLSVKHTNIVGTVRWTGHITKEGKDGNQIQMIVVGIETDWKVVPDRDFLNIHIDVKSSSGQDLFEISPGHSRVFVPEQSVIPAKHYKERSKEDGHRDERHQSKTLDHLKPKDIASANNPQERIQLMLDAEKRIWDREKKKSEELLQQQISNLERERDDLRAQLMEMQAMQQDTLELQGQIARLSIENMKLQGELKKNESWKISRKDVKMTKQELGRGGWGVIWVGQFRGQKVAVKQIHESIVSEKHLELLHHEINTMSQLRHPNLVQFIGAVLDDPSGQPLIITEIMDMSLHVAYKRKQLTPVPVHIPLAVMRDVAVGLNYLHCLPDPIIHDVNSANVLLESKGHARWKTKITDFGSAKFARAAITKATGAAAYSAPESLQSILDNEEDQLLTSKMDVFSYGVLLCEVLTCQFPDQQVFKAMLALVRSQHHPYLYDLIQSCIKRNPQDRPNMDQVIQQLDSPHT